MINQLRTAESSPARQSEAFSKVKTFVMDAVDEAVEPRAETLYSMREQAREDAGFSMLAGSYNPTKTTKESRLPVDEWVLDTEIIAIYW